jgi:hypothetical protein
VRFNAGDRKHPDLKKPWAKADANLPLAQNFALKTGADGRAEIQFETAGAVYLAENSVLLFKKLISTDGVATTQVELMSGTMSTNIEPVINEVFIVQTPIGEYTIKYPATSYDRIDRLLDGMAFTPESDGSTYNEKGGTQNMTVKKGQTLIYVKNGQSSELAQPGQVKPPNGWEDWVAARCAARQHDMQGTLNALGFAASVLGIRILYKGGLFSECSTFGACCGAPPQTETPEQTAARIDAERQAALEGAGSGTVSVKDLQQEATAHDADSKK